MLPDLKPYPAYRDSGTRWLGSVPEHWRVVPNRALFLEVNERDHSHEAMLSVTITRGVVRQSELLEDSSKKDSSREDKSSYKLMRPGDVAYNKMRAWQGAIGVSEFRGIVSPAYVVQRLRPGNVPRYYHYLLRTPAFAKEAERWSYGITSDMWSLRPEHFKLIRSCAPPLEEQRAILRFVRHLDSRIRRHMHAKQKLIKLLEEQRRTIIEQIVSGQIDSRTRRPYPVYKDSGIEWLGQVPGHWEVARLEYLTDLRRPIMYGIVLPGPNVDEGVYIVKGGNCEPGRLRPERLSRTTYEIEARYARSRLRENDIVIAIRGGVGATELVPKELEGANLTQDAARIAPAQGTNVRWLLTALRAPVFLEHVNARVLGATVRGINIRDLKRICLPVPSTDEQAAIAQYVETETSALANAMDRAAREIAFLQEYRVRLISDVVTGKLDVREAAANLPDEAEEPTSLPDEDLLVGESEFVEEEREAALEEVEA